VNINKAHQAFGFKVSGWRSHDPLWKPFAPRATHFVTFSPVGETFACLISRQADLLKKQNPNIIATCD
jgi:hypothetical protein